MELVALFALIAIFLVFEVVKFMSTDVVTHDYVQELKSEIEALYSPYLKESKFEKQIDFKEIYYKNGLDRYQIHGTPFYNIFSQFYSIQESFKLLYHNNYDQLLN